MRYVIRSKTMIAAAVIAALGIVESQYSAISNLIPDKYQGLGLVVVGAIMAVLRIYTTQPLKDK